MNPEDSRWKDHLASVGIRHDSAFGLLLWRVYTSRKLRWNAYVRACRKIPKSSPVHGLLSWKRINDRRHDLIQAAYKSRKKDRLDEDPEFRALQAVPCGEASTIVQNFLLARLLRRLEKKIPQRNL